MGELAVPLLISAASGAVSYASAKAAQPNSPTPQPTTPMPTYRDTDYAKARAEEIRNENRGRGRSGTNLSDRGSASGVNPLYTNTALGQ